MLFVASSGSGLAIRQRTGCRIARPDPGLDGRPRWRLTDLSASAARVSGCAKDEHDHDDAQDSVDDEARPTLIFDVIHDPVRGQDDYRNSYRNSYRIEQ